jgi:5'(3')-deoxyribonucleotidase
MKKETVFFDMDGVLVDFQSGIDALDDSVKVKYEGRYDEVPGIFSLMKPVDGAMEAVRAIAEKYETYVLSAAPWLNPSSLTDKINWLHKYFGSDRDSLFYKRVVITHCKNLVAGNYLIDDRRKWGADRFGGEFLQFGCEPYTDWNAVVQYLCSDEDAIKWKEAREILRAENIYETHDFEAKGKELFAKRIVYPNVWLKDMDEPSPEDGFNLANLFYRTIPKAALMSIDYREGSLYHNQAEHGAAIHAARKLRLPIRVPKEI